MKTLYGQKDVVPLLLTGLLILSGFACGNEERTESAAQANAATAAEASGAANGDDRGVPVEAMVVTREVVEQKVPLLGVLQPIHEVDIVAEVSGKVERIFKKLGDPVTPRDTLARIDDRIPLSQYRQAKAQLLSAENNLKIARLNLKSDEKLLQSGDISQLAYENSVLAVKTAEANRLSALANLDRQEKAYRDTRITSPIAGLVARKYIDVGMMVNSGMPVYRVVDLTTMKIEVAVPQTMVARVSVGRPARVAVSALPGRKFPGIVRFLAPQADESTGAFTAEVHIKNTPEFVLKAGMTARVELILASLTERLAVPDHAFVTRDNKTYVYRIVNNRARLTEITLGENFGPRSVVKNGLAPGDTIVVVGMNNLGVETKVWIEALH